MDRFFIDEPCNEDASAMRKVPGGRHCATCDHMVVDATRMTQAAFLRLVEQTPGKVCAQIRSDALGEAIFRQPPPPARPPRRHYAGGLVLLSALTSGGCATEPQEAIRPLETTVGAQAIPTQTLPPGQTLPTLTQAIPPTVSNPPTPPPTPTALPNPPTEIRMGGLRHVPSPEAATDPVASEMRPQVRRGRIRRH